MTVCVVCRVPSNVTSSAASPNPTMHNEDSDEEEFVYPGVEGAGSGSKEDAVAMPQPAQREHGHEPVEEFVYPGVEGGVQPFEEDEGQPDLEVHLPTPPSSDPVTELTLPSPPDVAPSEVITHPPVTIIPPPLAPPPKNHPTPAQLEAIQAAASNGDLNKLQDLFRSALEAGEFEPFALANDASPRTGLTALHAAASRGRLDIVKWRKFLSRW